jgi:hypothetical protein
MSTPENSKSDVAYAITKGLISSIPMVGGFASEMLYLFIQPPLEKRRNAWLESLEKTLTKISESGVDLSKLSSNEEFISTVVHATQCAQRTHLSSKHELLRNAIENSATPRAPEFSLREHFINCINDFSEIHIAILKIFNEKTPSEAISKGEMHLMNERIPALKGSSHMYEAFSRELLFRGLINDKGWYMQPGPPASYGWRTTPIGKQLLEFISQPQAVASQSQK